MATWFKNIIGGAVEHCTYEAKKTCIHTGAKTVAKKMPKEIGGVSTSELLREMANEIDKQDFNKQKHLKNDTKTLIHGELMIVSEYNPMGDVMEQICQEIIDDFTEITESDPEFEISTDDFEIVGSEPEFEINSEDEVPDEMFKSALDTF